MMTLVVTKEFRGFAEIWLHMLQYMHFASFYSSDFKEAT